MKVYFLLKSSYTPSCRLRVTDLKHIMEANGIEPEIDILAPTFKERKAQYKKAADFPVVVLQKRLLKWWDFKALRKNAKFLIFDFDDAIYLKHASPSTNPKDYKSSTRKRLFNRVIDGSDMVIASVKVLADKVKEIAPDKPCEIIASSVKMDEIEPRKDNVFHEERPIVGWTGTTSTFRYLEFIMPALKKAQQETNCLYRFIANADPHFPDIEYDYVQWEESKEYPTIRTFDVGLMPLSEDPFSVGKAAYKLLQYMCLGVPAVCSPVGMNKDVAGDDEYALAASTVDEFADKMILLIKDEKLRTQLAEKAKKLIAENYARDVIGVKLANTLKSALSS